MATVMCSSKLHKAIGRGRLQGTIAAPGGSVRLGDWAATLADTKLVVAIEERTCLTLVLPLRPIAGLRERFAAALRRALLGCGVSPRAVEDECRTLREASFVRRRHPALVEDLGFAEFEALAHVDGGQGEDSVQDMLNEFPYANCPSCYPTEAVALLFGRRTASERPRSTTRTAQPDRRGQPG